MSELSTDEIIRTYFEQNDILVKHQIESYNDYIDNIIPNILSQFSPIEVNINSDKIKRITLILLTDTIYKEDAKYNENNGVEKILTPDIARSRNYSYMLSLYIDIKIITEIIENKKSIIIPDKILEKIFIGKIPIMVNSKYCTNIKHNCLNDCKYDIGGYFIINGNEKVIISQERIASNIIQVFKSKNLKYSLISEVRSISEDIFCIPKLISIKLLNNKDKLNEIYVNIPNIKNQIPIIVLFKLYGCITDKEILYNIIDNSNKDIDNAMTQILLPSFEITQHIKNELDAYRFLFQYLNPNYNLISEEKKIKYIDENILSNVLPHINTNYKKTLFLGLMINKLLKCSLNIDIPSDRDSYVHKRIETPGILLGNITYLCYNKIIKEIKNTVNNEFTSNIYNNKNSYNDIINDTNIHRIIKPICIETTIKSSLATGNWGIKNNSNYNKTGVSQVLNRLTYASNISHLRRISSGNSNTGILIPPRKLHSTSWGYICPSETPEGQSVGLIKNLAISCEITLQYSSKPIREILKEYIITIDDIDIYKYDKFNNIKVILNGDWIGFVKDNINILNNLRKYRSDGLINIYISFYIDYINNILFIYSDRGRCIRPLLKISNKKLIYNTIIQNLIKDNKLNWSNLLLNIEEYKSIIEYIDIYEVNNILICNNITDIRKKNYTHCEISPSLILGILASCIPFANHNQSPRNTYQSAMGKQAMGIYSTNFKNRFDTFSHILYYPQKSIISTKYMDYFNTNKLPNGINVIVAIASYSGYNQEDSVILNKGAIDRGLFLSTFYRCYKEEENKNQLTGEEDKFCKPDTDNVLFPKNCNYNKLQSNGFVKENTFVDKNDIIIGKVIPIKHNEYKYRDTSINVKNNEEGYIDKNYININGEGFKFCKVKIRSSYKPSIGDKFSSRHGQKGTIGMIYDQCDMPFTKDGIVPDIIINPHAIPSRMTIAQLLECIIGKSCSIGGYNGDGTVFNKVNIDNITNILEEFNFEKDGNEVLYNGINGEQLKTSIFIGPTYYQRLKHMSGDKIHSRASGPIVSMTRQPSEGRASHGGLRFGEMERDCMISHGATNFLQERLMKVSDKFACYICNKCGIISIAIPLNNEFECNKCNNYLEFSKIYIPYSCKLLFQELQSMSIIPRFKINN